MIELAHLDFTINQYVALEEETVELQIKPGIKIRFDIHLTFENKAKVP